MPDKVSLLEATERRVPVLCLCSGSGSCILVRPNILYSRSGSFSPSLPVYVVGIIPRGP